HVLMADHAGHGLPLGLRAIESAPLLTADPSAFINPFLGLAEKGYTFGMGQRYGDGILRMAAFSGTGMTTNNDGFQSLDSDMVAHGVVVDYALRPTAFTSLSVQTGLLMEDGQILGLASEGVFGTPASVPSLFSSVTVASRLSDTWTLLAQAHGGVSRPDAPSLGLVKDTSPVIASAFSAGLTGGSVLNPDDRLSVILSQPLRVEMGELGLSLPTGRTVDGRLLQGNVDISLTPSGREMTLGIGYRGVINESLSAEIRTGVTRHPGHDAGAATELFGIGSFDLDF
ncbi:MAG: hypothetical protein V6Z81_06300, partial [Parvularculales bacterium]